MLKKLSGFAFGLLATLAVYAADVGINKDHPDTYVVQKGDTLWGIAGRFLTKPWLWPEIWQANPQVKNPHRIYPGDRLSLVYADGRPIMTVNGQPAFGPHVREEPLDNATTAVPLSDVQAFLRKYRVYNADDTKNMPYVLSAEEGRLLGQTGMLVYVRGLQAAPGSKVVVLRPTNEYFDVPKDYPWNSAEREVVAEKWSADRGVTVASWWKEVAVDRVKKNKVIPLGREVVEIANGEVLRSGDTSTILIQYEDYEVRKGDLVVVGTNDPFDLTFYPHPPAKVPDNMRVVAIGADQTVTGPHEVAVLTKGARDGVEVGQVYTLFQPGETMRDTVKYPENDVRVAFRPGKANVTLPEEYVGNVMVFRVFDGVSYALIMDGVRPARLYDVARAPQD